MGYFLRNIAALDKQHSNAGGGPGEGDRRE